MKNTKQNQFLKCSVFGVACGVLFISAPFAFAKSCDVDEDGDGDYKKISSAIKDGCDDLDVAKGTYSSDFALKGKLRGDGTDTVLTGKITMKDGSTLKKAYVKSGGITIANGADATIDTVRVKGTNVGIQTEGRGDLTVKNSEIIGNRKGFYIQAGKDVVITGTLVRDNSEEGIDIRANVDGRISGNVIQGNGESGIEVILGSSELIVSGNNIKNNGSSGIAAQYYKSAKKLGGLKVQNNKLNGNKSYGLDCKMPSGGNPSRSYWTDSIAFVGNQIGGNRRGAFAPKCHFTQEKEEFATLTEEEKVARIAKERAEREEALRRQAERNKEIQERLAARTAYEEQRKQEQVVQEQLLAIVEADYPQQRTDVQTYAEQVGAISAVRVFFTGHDTVMIAALNERVAHCKAKAQEVQLLATGELSEKMRTRIANAAAEYAALAAYATEHIEAHQSQQSIAFWR